jgi:hypothetical protein
VGGEADAEDDGKGTVGGKAGVVSIVGIARVRGDIAILVGHGSGARGDGSLGSPRCQLGDGGRRAGHGWVGLYARERRLRSRCLVW